MRARLLPAVLFFAALPAMCQEWTPLFDGRTLAGWRVTPFTNAGEAVVEDGRIVLKPGGPLSGVTRTDPFPHTHYEIRFEAMRVRGNDFFASITFPAGGDFCTWIAGGWGGDIVGLSSIDGMTATDNETRTYYTFENNRWYQFVLRVTPARITGWIDGERVTQADITGREISLRPGEIKLSAPLGFASFATEGALRSAGYRVLKSGD
jgi:hypothetical protein